MPLLSNAPARIRVNRSAPVGLASLAEQRGVQINFDRPIPTVVAPNGDFMFVTDREFQIMGYTPAPYVDARGKDANGAMWNPAHFVVQGFDELMATNVNDDGTKLNSANTGLIPYDPALNVGLQMPLTIPVGFEGSLVIGVRRNPYRNVWMPITKYVVFTFVKEVPPAGAYRPAITTLTKEITARASEVRTNVFRNIEPPTPSRSLATVKANENRQLIPLWFAADNEDYRRLESEPYNITDTGYAGNVAPDRARDFYALHHAASDAEKMDAIHRIVTLGGDVIGNLQRDPTNFNYLVGAGQAGGYILYGITRAFILGRADELALCELALCNLMDQTLYIEDEHIGQPTYWPNTGQQDNVFFHFSREWQGEPFWLQYGPVVGKRSSFQDVGFDLGDAHAYARYRNVADAMGFCEAIAAAALQNGPGGLSGAQWFSSLGKRHIIDYMDRLRHDVETGSGFIVNDTDKAFYDAVRSSINVPVDTSRRPGILPPAGGSGTANGCTFDFPNSPGGPAAATDRHFEYGLDGRSFVRVTGCTVGANTRSTGVMLGTAHFSRRRIVNANGPAPWTSIDGRKFNSAPVGFTSLGTPPSSAPVNSKLPGFFVRPYPLSNARDFYEITGTIPANARYIYGGIGYWFGGGKPVSWDYTFKRNGVAIKSGTVTWDGANGTEKLGAERTMRLPIMDLPGIGSILGGTLTLEVIANNANGSSSAAVSTGITLPSAFDGKGSWIPEAASHGAPPDYATLVWADTPNGLTYQLGNGQTGSIGQPAKMNGFGGYSLARRGWKLGPLPGMGDVAISEGDASLLSSNLSGAGISYPIAFGLVVRGGGATEAAASGYAVSLVAASGGTYTLQIRKISGGVIGPVVAQSETFNNSHDLDNGAKGYRPGVKTRLRVNWRMNGGALEIRAQAYQYPGMRYPLLGKPNDWHLFYSDPSPLTGTDVILHQLESRTVRTVYHVGLSDDPDQEAPHVPIYDIYTYS